MAWASQAFSTRRAQLLLEVEDVFPAIPLGGRLVLHPGQGLVELVEQACRARAGRVDPAAMGVGLHGQEFATAVVRHKQGHQVGLLADEDPVLIRFVGREDHGLVPARGDEDSHPPACRASRDSRAKRMASSCLSNSRSAPDSPARNPRIRVASALRCWRQWLLKPSATDVSA